MTSGVISFRSQPRLPVIVHPPTGTSSAGSEGAFREQAPCELQFPLTHQGQKQTDQHRCNRCQHGKKTSSLLADFFFGSALFLTGCSCSMPFLPLTRTGFEARSGALTSSLSDRSGKWLSSIQRTPCVTIPVVFEGRCVAFLDETSENCGAMTSRQGDFRFSRSVPPRVRLLTHNTFCCLSSSSFPFFSLTPSVRPVLVTSGALCLDAHLPPFTLQNNLQMSQSTFGFWSKRAGMEA